MLAPGFPPVVAVVVAAWVGYYFLRFALIYPALLYFWFLSSLSFVVLLNLVVAYHFNIRRRSAVPTSQTTQQRPLCHLRPLTFTRPDSWPAVMARRAKERSATVSADVLLFPKYPRASVALETMIDFILRDFVVTWYKALSTDPAFVLAVERAIRASFLAFGSRVHAVDTLLLVTGRIIPALTKHIRGCQEADRAVRRQQLGRTVNNAGDLNELLASKYRDGRLHPAVRRSWEVKADLAGPPDLVYVRTVVNAILPYILPPVEVQSRCLRLMVREIVAGAVLRPLMNMLADPDYWNQILLSLLTNMKTHRKPYKQVPPASMLCAANDRASKRSYEAFLKAINDCDNLVECKNMRSDIIAEMLYRKSLIEGKSEHEYVNGVKVKQILVYLNRLFLAKKKADKRITLLGGGSLKANRRSSFMRYLKDSTINISLREVLRSDNGRRVWESFVQSRDSLDRTEFWLAVDDIQRGLHILESVGSNADEGKAFEAKLGILFNLYDEFLAPKVVGSLGIEEPLTAEISSLVEDLAISGGADCAPHDHSLATCGPSSEQSGFQLSEKLAAAYRYIWEAQAAVERRMQEEEWAAFIQTEVYRIFASEYQRTHVVDSPGSNPHQDHLQSQDYYSVMPKSQSPEAERSPGGVFSERFLAQTPTATEVVTDPESMIAENSDCEPLETSSSGILFQDIEDTKDDTADPELDMDADAGKPAFPNLRSPTSLYRRRERCLETTGLNPQQPSNDPTTGTTAPKQLNLWDWAPLILTPFRRTFPEAGHADYDPNDAGIVRSSDVPVNTKAGGEPIYDPLASPPPKVIQPQSSGGVSRHVDLEFSVGSNPTPDDVQLAPPGDLLLESEVSRISSELYALIREEKRLDAEMAEADGSGDMEKSIRLKKKKLAVGKKVNDAKMQKARYEKQVRENALVPGKTQVYIRTWSIRRDVTNKEYAVFAVDVHQTCAEGIPLRGWLVEHRYSEFWTLHQQLKKVVPEVTNSGFPSKRAVLKSAKLIEMRRLALQDYLRSVLQIEEACASEYLRLFLCQRSIEKPDTPDVCTPVEDDGVQHPPTQTKKSIIRNLYRAVSEGFEDRTGSFWEAAKQIPRASNGSTAKLAQSIRGSTSSLNYEAAALSSLSEELRAESGVPSTTESLCDLFSEVFRLKENNNWLRRRSVIRILQQLFEGAVERRIRETIDSVIREDMVLRVRDALWPGGHWPKTPPSARTPEQKQQVKSEALYFLSTIVPDLLGGFVVRENARRGASCIFNAIQNPILNQHLIYCLFDEIVLACYGHEAADVVWTRHSGDSIERPKLSAV